MRRGLLIALFGLVVAAPAGAWNQIVQNGFAVKWANDRATVYYDPSTITGAFVSETQAGLNAWNNVSGSSFAFTFGGSSPSGNVKDTTNGNSDVYFDNIGQFGAYAVTWVMNSGTSLTDCDVTFHNGFTWSTAGANQPGGNPDFRTVAIHEFGHVLGLDHETVQPSVMQSGDPAISQHSIFLDDISGLRTIYPAPTGGGGGGGGTTPPPRPDLVMEAVWTEPAGPSPGDVVDVNATVRNAGAGDATSFDVELVLTRNTGVTTSDRRIHTIRGVTLAAGAQTTVTYRATIPTDLDPAPYRLGAVADPSGFTLDTNFGNNSAFASGLIFGGGVSNRIFPGTRVTGVLAPSARETFVLDLIEGTQLTLSATISSGAVDLRFLQQGETRALAEVRRYRKAKLKVTVPEDGTYVLYVTSQLGAVATTFDLDVGAKPLVRSGDLVVSEHSQISIPGYAGSRLDLRVDSHSDVRPEVNLPPALLADVKSQKKGKRVVVRPATVPVSGPLTVELRPGEGPSGSASWRFRIKFPGKSRQLLQL